MSSNEWRAVERKRNNGKTYWTVASGDHESKHKFDTKREAEHYADLLWRMDNPSSK